MSSSTLEENLTNSIRRAKQKIFGQNHSLGSNHQESIGSDSGNGHFDGRNRTYSQKNDKNSHNTRQNALAAAMKNLQDRIAGLEKENRELVTNQSLLSVKYESEGEGMTHLRRLVAQKQEELKVTKKQSEILYMKNADLANSKKQLEEQLAKMSKKVVMLERQLTLKKLDTQQKNDEKERQESHALTQMLLTKDRKISELQQKINDLTQRCDLKDQTMQKMIKQLEKKRGDLQKEKKINLRYIKLFQQQNLSQPDQNNSIEFNIVQVERQSTAKTNKSSRPRDYDKLMQHNKEMYQNIRKYKIKVDHITRQMKESQEKYEKLKEIVSQIVQTVKKIVPHTPSNLRFLLNRIDKLEHNHLQSLRSYSGNSRGQFRRSNSRQYKKSLKMSDLNSSSKKSRDRSATKSAKKSKLIQQLSHSQKKYRKIVQQQPQVDLLKKEIKGLKKQYRNLTIKTAKNNDPETQLQMDRIVSVLEQKEERLQQLNVKGQVRKSRRGEMLSVN